MLTLPGQGPHSRSPEQVQDGPAEPGRGAPKGAAPAPRPEGRWWCFEQARAHVRIIAHEKQI